MTSWYGTARSNYVKVKDLEAFKVALAPWPIEVSPGSEEHPFKVCLLSQDEDNGGWPSIRSDDDIEFDVAELICPHLADGEVLILMEAGAEHSRYVTGIAQAYTSQGLVAQVRLSDIYEVAATVTGIPRQQISACEY